MTNKNLIFLRYIPSFSALFLFFLFQNNGFAITPKYSSTESRSTAKVDMEITVTYNPNPAFIDVEQTTFIKTQADGFSIKNASDPDRYRKIGTTFVTWQPKGVYEVLIYTDNIHRLNLTSTLPPESETPANKAKSVDFFAGINPPKPWPNYLPFPYFIPVKVWVPRTAGPGQDTAPVNPNGSIDPVYWDKDSAEQSYFYVPERMAVDMTIGTYGSYKKVIASTQEGTNPFRLEVTFAIDLSDNNFNNNYTLLNHKKYEGVFYFDLVGN